MTWRDYGDGIPTYQTGEMNPICVDCDGDCRVCSSEKVKRG